MLNRNLGGAFSMQKKSATPAGVYGFGSSLSFGDWGNSYEAILSEPTVLAAIKLICNTISAMNLTATKGDETWDKYSQNMSGELAVILRQPNDHERTKQLVSKIVFNLVRHNEAFIQVKGNSKSVRAIECIADGKCSRFQNGNGIWEFQGTDNQNKVIIDKEMFWLSGPTPSNTAFDFLEAGRQVVDLSTAAIKNATAFNKKGPKSAGFAMTDSKLNDENYNRLRDQLDRMTEEDAAGQIAILEKMTFQPNPFNARDAAIVETRSGVSKDIAALLGVPLQLLGFAESAYKDLSELRAVFLSSVIDPIVTEIEDCLNAAYGYRYVFDFDESELLNAQFDLRAGVGMQLFSLGLATKDEARDFADLAPLPEGGDQMVAESNNLTFGTGNDSPLNTENGGQ